MMSKKVRQILVRKNGLLELMISGVVLLFLALAGVLGAVAITTALNRTDIVITNNSGVSASSIALPFNMSTVDLIDASFIDSDCLNCAVQQSDETIGFMPGSDRVRVLAAFNNAGVDETTAANNAALDDITLPAATANIYEFAFDHQARFLRLNVSTPVVATTYTVVWEYWNGSTYVALDNVVDRTSSFSLPGENEVFWDFPAASLWPSSSLHAITGYWIRANVTATGIMTPPTGARAFYETGRWWVFEASIPDNDSRIYNLYTGGPDHVSSHQWFPGADGATTTDDAVIELGSSFSVEIIGRLNATHPTTGSGGGAACIACKADAFELYWSATDAITLDVTGSGGQSFTITGITLPTTGSQTTRVVSDGSNLSFTIDGIGVQTGTAETITDNANPWVWADESTMIYIDKIGIASSDFETTNTQATWDSGTKTAVTSFVGAREDILTDVIPTRAFRSLAITDTGRWNENGSTFDNTDDDVDVGFPDPDLFNSFFRFPNIALGQGETVIKAQIKWWNEFQPGVTTKSILISALDADDASAPTTFAQAETPAAGRTTASVAWTHPDSTQWQVSPDISTVIQEILDRATWASGNAIVIYTEDNGSASGEYVQTINAFGSLVDGNTANKPVLEVWLLQDTSFGLADDFIQQDVTVDPVSSWTVTESGTGQVIAFINPLTLSAPFAPIDGAVMVNFQGTASGSGTGAISQNIATTPGVIWSIGANAGDSGLASSITVTLRINWLDSGLATISSVSTTVTTETNSFVNATVLSQTAPALTAFMQFQFERICITTCDSGNRIVSVDGMMACIGGAAPTYPNACNQLVNPSFERVYQDSASTWESGAIVLNATSVADTWVVFDGDEPSQDDTTDFLVEGSLDAIAYTAITSGDDFPGVTIGDDISAQNLFIRITFTSTNDLRSAFVNTLQVGVIDANGNLLRYEPILPIGTALVDRTGFGNDSATVTLPVTLANFSASIQSTEATTPTTPGTTGPIPVDIIPDIQIIADVTGDATAADGSGLIWFLLFDLAADETGFPKQAMLFAFALTVTLMAVFGAWLWSKNMWIAWGALVFFLVVFTFGIPILPVWVLFLCGIFGLLFPITASRQAV